MNDFSWVFFAKALLIAIVLAGIAWRMGLLSFSGFVAASILGAIVYGLGGLEWAFLLAAFFLSSSLLSRSFGRRKAHIARTFAKGGRRDWAQVAANGGVGAIMIVLVTLGRIDAHLAWLGFAASLAAVNADTWATELGVLNRSAPRLLTSGRKVEAGTSGAISLTGSLAALTGALLIGALGFWLMPEGPVWSVIGLVTFAGFMGAMIDSLLGATLQAIYFCPKDDKETEQHPQHHCGTATTHMRGWGWMSNDWVNFVSAAGAAAIILATAALLGLVG